MARLVEERILDAAAKVFLKRGFEGASVDEIADVARAGKPTIYAVPWQGGAVRRGDGAHVREITSSFESIAPTGATIEERLASIAMAFLRKVLVAETVGLIRAAVAEARRFPDLAASVSRMGLERGTEAVTQLLASLRNPTKYRRSRPTAAPPPRAIVSAADAHACAVRRAPHSAARRDRAACRANGGVLSCCMQTGRNWLD